MKKLIVAAIICVLFYSVCFGQTGKVGINTTTPQAILHVKDSSVIFTGLTNLPVTPGNPPVSGAGIRMMWYPDKAAFRVGKVFSVKWNKDSIGDYSFASGYDTKAVGDYSTAMGFATEAVAIGSTAIGATAIASGNYSIAMGFGTEASGIVSTAMGSATTASGSRATSMGFYTVASGDFSTAIGSYVSTNGHEGTLAIGDHSTASTMTSATDNTFRARFDGGYRFYTSSDLTSNALLASGDNAWSTSSDRNLKENFAAVKGEEILKKISDFYLTSWNYKKQNPAIHRHYGPMAQDFFVAFGTDKYGTIGTDSTINQADFIGINFIAIQALEKRTTALDDENKKLKEENKEMQAILGLLQKEVAAIKELLLQKNIAR